MNSKNLNVFKIFLFIFGLAVIGAAFFIAESPLPENGLPLSKKFIWLNIVFMYLVFFCPFFFSSISTKNIDTKITSAIGVWISVILFEIAAIILTVLVFKEKVSFKTAILAELILIFICGIFIYFGYFAGNHIGKVHAAEKQSLGKLSELKSAFELLDLKRSSLGGEFYEQGQKIRKICDDVKYLSPVNTDSCSQIEQKMIIAASILAESHFTPAEMEQKIQELDLLLRQRKLQRN